jgi:prepilin-type processing-associated H-X9-DG protein
VTEYYSFSSEPAILAAQIRQAAERDNRRANVVFCDGLAETRTLKSLIFDKDDAALRRWNKDPEPHR